MLLPWQCTLQVTTTDARLLVTESSRDLLKARLDLSPRHPRALLTVLEGLSLWSGEPLRVALCVDETCPAGLEPILFGDGLWPAESPLVQFDIVPRVRPKHLDAREFHALRRYARRSAP